MTEGNPGWRKGPATRFVRALAFAATAAFLAGIAGAGAAIAAGAPTQLVYRVTHSIYGNIGTYINTVEPVGEDTMVLTRAHFEVSLLGVDVYREDAQRTERWQGNRLVAFHGVTDRGKGPTEVKGEARGDAFVITSPQGTVDAPATVHPANPWSSNFLDSHTMMRPDTGRVERVKVSAGEPTTVTIGGTPIAARKYDVDGKTRYTVWLDGRGVPVKFIVEDDSGTVTFTLANCVRCGLDGGRLGEK